MPVPLSSAPGGETILRTLPGPLAQSTRVDTVAASASYGKPIGDWQLTATVNATHTSRRTRADDRADTSALVAAAAAGDLAIDGPLPVPPDGGVSTSRSRSDSLTSLATIVGRPL